MELSSIFVGINGNVFCLDRVTGHTVWAAELKGSNYVTLLLDGDLLFAGTRGEVYCLRASTGEILWKNEMPGQGLGLLSIASATGASNPDPAEEERRRQAAAARAAASAR